MFVLSVSSLCLHSTNHTRAGGSEDETRDGTSNETDGRESRGPRRVRACVQPLNEKFERSCW